MLRAVLDAFVIVNPALRIELVTVPLNGCVWGQVANCPYDPVKRPAEKKGCDESRKGKCDERFHHPTYSSSSDVGPRLSTKGPQHLRQLLKRTHFVGQEVGPNLPKVGVLVHGFVHELL
jgi:hypothetical protein